MQLCCDASWLIVAPVSRLALVGFRGGRPSSCYQGCNESAEQGFAALTRVVHEPEEAEIEREHSKSWGADRVGLGSGLTGRGWAGAEASVACEAGCGAAAWDDDGNRGCLHRARRAGRRGRAWAPTLYPLTGRQSSFARVTQKWKILNHARSALRRRLHCRTRVMTLPRSATGLGFPAPHEASAHAGATVPPRRRRREKESAWPRRPRPGLRAPPFAPSEARPGTGGRFPRH